MAQEHTVSFAPPPDPPEPVPVVRPADTDTDAERTALLKQIRETRLSPTSPTKTPKVFVDGREIDLDDSAEITLDSVKAIVQQNKAAIQTNRQSLADLRAAHAASPTGGFKLKSKK